MKLLTGTIIAAFVFVAAHSHAQIIEKKSLNLDGAKKAIAAAVDYAKKNNAPGGVIAVVDEGGNLMALERLDGTFAMGATISSISVAISEQLGRILASSFGLINSLALTKATHSPYSSGRFISAKDDRSSCPMT